jgi:aspartate/methionine/tyrosine aminotransferase
MSQGVPGIPPPRTLLDALASASADPASCGYVPNAGEPALRETMTIEMKKVYGQDADVTLNDIFLTAGCNLAFTAAITAIAEKGDEVILPVPW